MSDAATPKKKSSKAVWIVVCLIAVGGGYLYSNLSASSATDKAKEKDEKPKKHAAHSGHRATVPFGDVVVNLAEERMTRYIRVKIVLEVDEKSELVAVEHIAKHKAAMKSWLISHLASKRLTEVAGSVGVNRLQREILERFDEMLYPEQEDRLLGVLFEEFMVQ
jgi:flagellar protein FliL